MCVSSLHTWVDRDLQEVNLTVSECIMTGRARNITEYTRNKWHNNDRKLQFTFLIINTDFVFQLKFVTTNQFPHFGRRIVISKSKNVDVVIKLWRSERWTREIFNSVLANNNLKKTRLKSSEWNNVKFFISCFNITYKSINYLGKCFDSKTHLENHTGLQL